MVIVKRLSKYAHLCALQHRFKAFTLAQVFMDNIWRLHGMPQSIVSDHDPTFTSNFWWESFGLQVTQVNLSTTVHPKIDD